MYTTKIKDTEKLYSVYCNNCGKWLANVSRGSLTQRQCDRCKLMTETLWEGPEMITKVINPTPART